MSFRLPEGFSGMKVLPRDAWQSETKPAVRSHYDPRPFGSLLVLLHTQPSPLQSGKHLLHGEFALDG